MPVSWPDQVDEILGGDLTAALGYVTPAGGAVVMAVAPIGLRDRERGSVGFTTSLGFAKKLDRIRREPRVALAYHAREHGSSSRPEYVLVQGRAEPVERPSPAERQEVREHAERHLGKGRSGAFWDRWLREYYSVRIPVRVHVERVSVWPDLRCAGERELHGLPDPGLEPEPQPPPKKGTGPRVDMRRAAKRLAKTPYLLLGYLGSDGYPIVVPVELRASDERGLELGAAPGVLPAGARRAGLLGTPTARSWWASPRASTPAGSRPRETRGSTPRTRRPGFVAPPNKTLLLFFNGLQAKRGVRAAARA